MFRLAKAIVLRTVAIATTADATDAAVTGAGIGAGVGLVGTLLHYMGVRKGVADRRVRRRRPRRRRQTLPVRGRMV